MAAKPIIYGIEAGNDLVAEARCGISIPPEDPLAVVSAARQLRCMSMEARKVLGESGRQFVMTHHLYESLAERFLEAILSTEDKDNLSN